MGIHMQMQGKQMRESLRLAEASCQVGFSKILCDNMEVIMDFKIKITCHKCRCVFELRSNFLGITQVSCPCCSSKVLEDINANLLMGMKALHEVPNDYSEKDGDYMPDGFSFEVIGRS